MIAKAHQFLTFTTPPNLQAAVAYGLGKPASYFAAMRAGYAAVPRPARRRAARRGFEVLPSQGTYFLNIDIAPARRRPTTSAFCEALVEHHGVAAIPVSAFYPTARAHRRPPLLRQGGRHPGCGARPHERVRSGRPGRSA